MPLRLTPLEHILGRLNLLPVPLFDTPLAAGLAKMLVTACELGVFDALDKRSLSLQALAEQLQCHPQGLQLLLQLLVSAGYLRHRRGRYRNTAMAQRWLTGSSPVSIAPYVIHSPDIVAIWDHLPEVIRENKQAMTMPYDEDASKPEMQAALARHYAGLASLAMALGGEVVNRVRVPRDATQLLDVGGSHAAYSVLFCRKYPRLHATILDIQPGIEAGQRTVKQADMVSSTTKRGWLPGQPQGPTPPPTATLAPTILPGPRPPFGGGTHMVERMNFIVADIVRDDFTTILPTSYDVALYFHIAHLLPPEINISVLAKVAKSLRSGGVLAFVDQVTGQSHGSRLASLMVQFMALTMTTVGGTCYPFPTVKSWLEQVGMGNIRRHHLFRPGATLITAVKK